MEKREDEHHIVETVGDFIKMLLSAPEHYKIGVYDEAGNKRQIYLVGSQESENLEIHIMATPTKVEFIYDQQIEG